MLNFLKHHWTRREKMLAKIRGRQILIGILLGIIFAGLLIANEIEKDRNRVTELQRDARAVVNQQGVVLPPRTENLGGDFTLVDQDGKTVHGHDFLGKYLLVYFGYTYCPDECPTGLQGIARALDLLGNDAPKVQPLFITIDPARDTPDKLKAYVSSFHPQILGLSGTDEQIADVAKKYQVYYAKGEKVDDQDYMMDHSTLIYIMGPDGKFLTSLDSESDPEILAQTLKKYLAAPEPSSSKP